MQKYDVILADPPWAFKTFAKKNVTPHRAEKDHYETMEFASLADIPVNEWAKDDCALFMWVVDSNLPEALKLIEAWGFTYKTIAFNWVKLTKDGVPKMGMGYWTRKQSEICLLATKGKPKRVYAGVRQVIMSEPREHSRKPDQQYQRIEALMGSDGTKLEMFARQSWPGWDAWGNETTKFQTENANGNT